MTDIVERLRNGERGFRSLALANQAADEIESLRSRLAEAETLLREIREDARHFGMPTARIDAHLSRKEVQT